MIEPIPNLPEHIVALSKTGEENPEDFDKIFVPAVQQAQQNHDKIRLLFQMDSEPSPDSKVGIKEFAQFEKVTLVTDSEAVATRIKTFSFMIPCEIRVFPVAELEQAKTWITE